MCGTQMDGGWFAEHSEFGPVFIKHFTQEETENALRESAIFDSFGEEEHANVASPLATVTHDGHVVLMQARLGVIIFRADWVANVMPVLFRVAICLTILDAHFKKGRAISLRRCAAGSVLIG